MKRNVSKIQNSSPLDMEETHGDEDVSPPLPWALERMLQAQQLESPHQSPIFRQRVSRKSPRIGSLALAERSGQPDQDRC